MSTINYSLNHKGVRLITSEKAWTVGKGGKPRLNQKYHFIGKIEMSMPNMIMSATDNKKPTYKGDVYDLNSTAKKQVINHFYDERGKRNKKTVAYFGITKEQKNK